MKKINEKWCMQVRQNFEGMSSIRLLSTED